MRPFRPPSPRAISDGILTESIKAIHEQSRGTYGAPRIHIELRLDHNIRCACKRVARLMRAAGLEGCYRRRLRGLTWRDPGATAAPDLVERNFRAAGPDRLWTADITYVPTRNGFVYLAVVLDAYSRMVVGWSIRDDLTTQLVLDALDMAICRWSPGEGLVHHSDSEYVGAGSSWAFLTRTAMDAQDVGAGTPPGFLTRTPIDEMSFLGTVGCPGTASEALASQAV